MKKVILLNRKFPYKSGEAFLENEIDEISKYFDEIYIYPSDVSKNETMTRKIKSNNVKVRIIENIDFSKRKIIYAIYSIKYFFKYLFKLGLKKALVEAYFNSAAALQAKNIIKDLDTLKFAKNDDIFIYSYWLYINAKAGCIIKEYFKKNNKNVKLISRAHRFDIYEEKRKNGYLPGRLDLLENVDKIYACSDDGASYIKKRYPKYENKIEVGYLGTYDHGQRDYQDHENFNIVSCSRLSTVKRVDLIIKALQQLDSSKENITWTHIGGGTLLEELKQLANNSLKNVKFNFLGSINNKDVYEYYLNNDVDLFINVSSSEGLPVSIMEAISFGIPVIATDVGGTSEIVKQNISGFLLNENFQTDELATLIIRIKKMNKNDYLKLRNSTRTLWKKQFNAPTNYKLFSDNIKEKK